MFLAIFAAYLGAQEHNAVPLDHPAYEIIAMGALRGAILPPPGTKPWTVRAVKHKLREMADNSAHALSAREMEIVLHALNSLERSAGFAPQDGRYRNEGDGFAFEAGLGWESNFSIGTPGASIASQNTATMYAGGDAGNFASWNAAAWGEFLYIEREGSDRPVSVPSAFPHTSSRQWDGGVLSLRNPGYAGWPDDPSLAFGAEAELNAAFSSQHDQLLHLRLGRLRRDWGYGSNGNALFLSTLARPFAAFECSLTPLSWLNISFLCGALEHYRETGQPPHEGPFANALSAAQIALSPLRYFRLCLGGAAVMVDRPDAALFADLELRLPGLLSLRAGLFVDQLHSPDKNFFSANDNSYAFQAGVKANIRWLPFAAFSFRYTKVEPYCYAAFMNGGESLGYYLPPNSDELLLRFESMLFPGINAHAQYQMIRSGAGYGYGAVGGSSRHDFPGEDYSIKYFLMDGVYQWDNVIKLGGSFSLKSGGIPLALYAETGMVITRFTINGNAGVGNEADYESLNNDVYRARNGFIFSVGFRLFPNN